MADDTMTLAEIGRRLARLEGVIDARLNSLEVLVADKAAQAVMNSAIDHRLDAIEDNQKAMSRMLMTAFLGIVIQAGFFILTVVTGVGRSSK